MQHNKNVTVHTVKYLLICNDPHPQDGNKKKHKVTDTNQKHATIKEN